MREKNAESLEIDVLLPLVQQSPIQSQFEQSLLTVQNAAQRTFSLLFPLLKLGRSAQVSCAVRGPFVISSLRMDLYLSELYHHLCDLQSVWGKNYLPNPKTGKWSVWYESAEYRGKERGWRRWVFVRAWVWVGGSIKIFEQKATKMSTYSTWTCLQVKARSQHDMSFRPVGWFHFSIVTAHKFFVLPNNHPFNHNLSKACSQCRTQRSALFLSCFLCLSWVVLHKFPVLFVVHLWSHLYGWICIWVNCITICVIFNLFGVRTICPSSVLTRRRDDRMCSTVMAHTRWYHDTDVRLSSFYWKWVWNCWIAGVLSNPCLWANDGFPTILFMVCTRCSVGACSMVHPNVVAIVKSRRLNGSAMFALLGTLLSICVSCCRLCQAQCDPIRLLSGWCLPDPLLIAWVAGSLSHSCMYGCVSNGLTRAGVTMAAQASRKYMYARLLVKCRRIFQGTTPWITIGVLSGGNTTAAHPFV